MDNLPDVKLSQLRHFIAVVEQKGFHSAARKLFRSQPAISLSIKDLEEKLGGALFEKGGSARLTPLGVYAYPLARELIRHYDLTLREVLRVTRLKVGRLGMAAVPSVAVKLLPEIIRDFVARYPDILVQVQDDNAEHVQQKLLAGEVDLGIASLWEPDERIVFEPLIEDRMGVICHREHPLARVKTLTWDKVAGHTLIRNGTLRLLDGTAAEAVWADCHLTIDNTTSLLALVEAGVGITALPSLAFPENAPALCFRVATEPTVKRCVGLLTLKRYTPSPAAQAMRALVVERFARTPETRACR